MSVSTRHRITLLACAAFLAASAAFAAAPSGRTATRMVYNTETAHMILFGGTTKVDAGTRQSYDLADTWEWNGDRWVQLYPAHSPKGRSFHTMVYDSNHDRVLLFGGKSGTATANATQFNDTWSFDGADWTQINTPNAPSTRIYPGSTFDPLRDRMVLFGGTTVSSDGKTSTNLYDTWEFDGTTWKQTSATGPILIKPILVYDSTRNRVVMVGTNDKNVTVMYTYDGAAGSWTPLTPATLPTCAVDAQMAYSQHDDKIVLFGGVCTDSDIAGDTWSYDGTNWTKLDATALSPDRLASEAFAYDASRQEIVLFGGTLAFGNPTGATRIFKDNIWAIAPDPQGSPAPRSLFAFVSNPDKNLIWLVGGMNDTGLGADEFYQFQNGPTLCSTPNGVYDSDRQKLIVVCADSSTFEYDGTDWKTFTLKTVPTSRNFSSMVYDKTLKKTVLFGGFGNVDYTNETWTWDGAAWTRVKKNPPTARALAAMWYDPTLKKTLLFGGIGRKSSEDRIERFSDMWSFDGNGWTLIKNVATVPGQRYGSQVAVDPRTGKVLLFGGLVLDVLGATQNQVYKNDFWSWDGTTWTKLDANAAPPPRENGALAYDPSTNQMVLFAGFSGYYLSDLWMLDAQNAWHLQAESANPPVVIPPRRRGLH
jgi:hypothetical protein